MKRSPLIVIFTTVFIDLVGFGIVIPVLPYYTEGTSFTVPAHGRTTLRVLLHHAVFLLPDFGRLV